MTIKELMTRDVATVTPDTSLKDIAALLAARRISGLPVCSPGGRVVGVVSEADILWKERGIDTDPGLVARLRERADARVSRADARTAGEAMSAPAITIDSAATVSEAARLLLAHRINRLPVVDHGRLVGIVTRADLVRAFARPDAEIELELRDDVLVKTLWLSPDDVHIAVAAGEVTLSGETDTRSSADLLVAFARRVPGVVAVTSNVTWDIDDQSWRSQREARRVPQAHGPAEI